MGYGMLLNSHIQNFNCWFCRKKSVFLSKELEIFSKISNWYMTYMYMLTLKG